MQVDGQTYNCLLDTGATYSTLTGSHLTPGEETRTVMGLDGIPRNCPLSKPANVSVGPLSVNHTFLLTSSPVNLLGRDLLCKLNATIQCGQEGIYLHMPDESIFNFQGVLQEAQTQNIDLPPELLNNVSPTLWGTESTSVGLLKSATPVIVNYRQDLPFPCTKQYPLPPEAIQGLTPMIEEFLKMGVLVPCASPCNTPLLPVKKPNTNPVKWRLVQDLRLVNSFVIPRHAVVANPHHLLSTIPEGTVVYSVIDLCSAFFSIPVDPKSQFLFAFTWQTGQLTWTRLPQGYVESPAIFSSILHQDLADVTLPGGSALRLYVDDILLCGRDLDSCRNDTIALLNILADKGHKVSPKKIQYCKEEVKYLGHILGKGTRALTTDRIETITKLPLPKTKRQLRGFIGMSGFCRAWIPRYGEFTRPLTAMTHEDAPDQLQWSAEALEAFESIKRELRSAPALGLPDYRLPFTLYVHENRGVASGVLTQPFQGKNRPVAYYSLQLDTTVLGNVGCLRAVAAAALLLEKAQETVLGHDLTVNVPHAVATLLSLQGCQRFTIQRLNKYEAILLSPSNVTIKRVNSLNPATLLPLPDDGTPHHDCSQIVRHLEKPREDLDYLPLTDPDLVLYTDGSSKVVGGERKSGYAVVTDDGTLEARPVNARYSAQAAELIALIRACELGAGQKITIYTDSKYCFGLVHATGQIWLQRGFLTTAGTQIAHAPLVQRLMDSIHLPEAIAVVHCKAHTKGKDLISIGNRCADRAAQEAALQPFSADNEFQGPQIPSDINFAEMYQTATPGEIKGWEEQGAHFDKGVWYAASGQNIPLDENIHPYKPGDWILAKTYHKTITKECWICANAPSHLHSGIPFLGVPLTLQQHLSADVQSWNLTAVNLTHQYIYLTGPTTGDLCRKFSGNDKLIGDSTCKYTIDIAFNGRIILWHQGNPSIQPSLMSAWKRVMTLPDSWSPSPVSQCFFRTFLTGRIDSCLQGLFWVCGHRGYVWASPHSRGTCYLGLILPGVRVTPDLPSGRRRNKRAKDLSQLSDVAANSETYGRALFPAYGAGSNHVDILKLTDILLNFMEESNAATQAILTELTEVRQTSIQNRLALDYVLASTGGVCALVGTECCTH
uniref:uncharacterized protein LOC114590397 n=1 Tax=Podarcis muralis TaxID=64176 RepID=UPI0010A0C0C6